MVTAFDVDAKTLIGKMAEKLKEKIKKPTWMDFVKTGSHVGRAPQQKDFWWIRCASLLRKLYVKGQVGVSKLRKEYGGRVKKGSGREHRRIAGGAIIRKALQVLEGEGYVAKAQKGRTLTSKGKTFVDSAAKEIA